MMAMTVTAAAHPSLALVKYWGNADDALNIPSNNSISLNLGGATTKTTVTFDAGLDADTLTINGAPAGQSAYARVVRHLDRVRALASIETRAAVESHNDFPASAGVASSASAFAALSLAASRAAGLDLDVRALSILARKGSGSACRSIPGGFVEWRAGEDDATSFAQQIAPSDWWDLRVTTVIIAAQPKEISSTEGHRTANTSPFYKARLEHLPRTLATVRGALAVRDFTALGQAVEREAVSLHVVAMTAAPPSCGWCSGIYYWRPETIALIHALQIWRSEGLEVYFTMDAGANVHILSLGEDQPALEDALAALPPEVGGRYIVSRPGRGAWVVEA
jgi:diphosphomevalonate decarboxylase